jgi:hypothetical protein
LRQPPQLRAVVEQARVEEIGGEAPGLRLNSPKRRTPERTANSTKSWARASWLPSATMGNSFFKLTSLNLNGIRSAASKGIEAWLARPVRIVFACRR